VSSVFDYLTFGLLLLIYHAKPEQFRTGWFLESVVSATLIVLVIRSRRPFYKSRPGKYLVMATLLVIAATLLIPFTPLGTILGFQRISFPLLAGLGLIVALYIVTAEWAKKKFYSKENNSLNIMRN
jgi:Mg2+-importing ATPase